MVPPDRVAVAKDRLRLYLAGERDDPGYEAEDLLMFDVWCVEKADLDSTRASPRRSNRC